MVHYACAHGWLDVLKVLHVFSKPEDINARRNAGGTEVTPLMLAGAQRHFEVVEFLLSSYNDIDINAASANGGHSTLHMAFGNPEMIKLLLDMSKQHNLGIDINAKEVNGKTVFHKANCLDEIESLEILIENGANILAMPNENEGEYIFTKNWKQSNEKFLEYLDVTEELTTLERLKLFTDNLDLLSNAIPKKGELEKPYTISVAEIDERRRCDGQRIMLLFLKTFRDQNIDLRGVEDQFVDAENTSD